MRFTLIGHSCVHVETSAGTILVDPWLSGSCYWRSWWHYPPTEVAPEVRSPDLVYLTHHHFDHFHYPSMRTIDRTARINIPRFGVDVMSNELVGLGFDRVTELPHGEITDLGNGVRIASFQYGIDDSAFVIADGDDVLVDVNDCKIRGRALRDIVDSFGHPTFAMKAHSFAQSYPLGYSADDPGELNLVRRDTLLDDFLGVMRELQPRYAVPFGSMVGFLHPESFHVNAHLITPFEVRDHVEAAGGFPRGEVVPMIPGEAWSSEGGFEHLDRDWYSDREANLRQLAEQERPKIDASLAAEAGRHLIWEDFQSYMSKFVRAFPPLVGNRLIPRPVCFEIASDVDSPYWSVSVPRREILRSSTPPVDAADLITVPEAILADAIRDDILGVVHGSMRIHTHLSAGGAPSDLAFWGMIAVHELGYLPSPWTRALIPGGPVLNRRMLGVGWRRRHEVMDILKALLGRGSALERISNGFGADATATGRAA